MNVDVAETTTTENLAAFALPAPSSLATRTLKNDIKKKKLLSTNFWRFLEYFLIKGRNQITVNKREA